MTWGDGGVEGGGEGRDTKGKAPQKHPCVSWIRGASVWDQVKIRGLGPDFAHHQNPDRDQIEKVLEGRASGESVIRFALDWAGDPERNPSNELRGDPERGTI